LGFESFSESGKEDRNLQETLAFFFNSAKISGLTKSASMSYPEFLNQLS
jgi:hypothetical protein